MEVLEDLSDIEEVSESVPVGYMGMAMNNEPLLVKVVNHVPDDWRKHYPIWQHPELSARQQIGDCHDMISVRRSGPRNRKKTENWTGPD